MMSFIYVIFVYLYFVMEIPYFSSITYIERLLL
jgi:hypothetical protein